MNFRTCLQPTLAFLLPIIFTLFSFLAQVRPHYCLLRFAIISAILKSHPLSADNFFHGNLEIIRMFLSMGTHYSNIGQLAPPLAY